jgi:acyl-CoA reductase-like NAD-dependent aldehyde dehydrogenase
MPAEERIPILKTYKMYVGGQFPRTESGRSYLVRSADGDALANACRGSRKDVRDAVRIARAASGGWAGRTAMNRGQILYRVAELMEGRFDQFTGEVAIAEGLEYRAAREVVGRAIDRWVWYAGWTDKIAQVLGSSNPVGAPYFNFTIPEPTGVVGVVAPDEPSLLGLVAEIAPALAAGNTVVAILSDSAPLGGLDLAEALGVSDVPGGVVNLLSGRRAELAPALGAHRNLNAIVDAAGDSDLAAELDRLASETIKRTRHSRAAATYDEAVADALNRIEAVTELKTAWHPIGA